MDQAADEARSPATPVKACTDDPPAGEVWSTIKGYDGLYEASTFGRVRRVCESGEKIVLDGSIQKLYSYIKVHLTAEGERPKKKFVHRLILETFKGPPPDKESQLCCHLDGNPLNNKIENLYWGSYKKNAADRDRHGNTCRGERSSVAVLKDKDVLNIVDLLARGESIVSIVKKTGINDRTVRDVVSGRTWSHVSGIKLCRQ